MPRRASTPFSPSARRSGTTPNAASDRPVAAEAIVVLGCKLRPGGVASAKLRRRVALGVQIYLAAAAPYLLLVGGGAPVAEAAVMRELALAAGVPDAALICETRSRNTSE